MVAHPRRKSRSAKAGLLFPVSRLEKYHRRLLHHVRMSSLSPVYLAGVLEYLTAELLELAGNNAKTNSKKRITPRHLLVAIAMDSELCKALGKVTLPGAGHYSNLVLPAKSPASKQASKKAAANKAKASNQAAAKVKTPKKAPSAKDKAPKLPKSKATKKKAPITKRPIKKQTPAPQSPSASTVNKSRILNANIKILSEKTLFLGQKLTVIQGDLLAIQADAIINPTDSRYYLGGLIGTALKTAGGPQFEQEIAKLVQEKGVLPPAGAVLCPLGISGAPWAIHCNGPHYREPNSTSLLEKTIRACLAVADSSNLKVLAIPSVGSGRAGFPKKTAAEAILGAISHYFASVMMSSLKQIYFVLYDKESISAYVEQLNNLDVSNKTS